MENLKQCPFCGGQPIRKSLSGLYTIECAECGAYTPLSSSEGAAVNMWNRGKVFDAIDTDDTKRRSMMLPLYQNGHVANIVVINGKVYQTAE